MQRFVLTVTLACIALSGFGSALGATEKGNGTIYGIVLDNQANVVKAAAVSLAGSTINGVRKTLSGDDGKYKFAGLPAGTYSVSASKGALTPATITGITLSSDQIATEIDIQLLVPTLNSIRTLGRVVTSASKSTFNTSTASQYVVSSSTLKDQAQLSVSRVLDQTPGIVTDYNGYNAANSFAPRFVNIRGGQDYESQQTIDGHPVSNGVQGSFRTNFLNASALQSIEIAKGPGSAPDSISGAIAGAVNYQTKEPTEHPYYSLDLIQDSFWGQQLDLSATGTTSSKRLGYAFDYTSNGSDGPPISGLYQPVSTQTVNGLAVATSPNGSTPLVPSGLANFTNQVTAFWQPQKISGEGILHSYLAKLRYHFSDATTGTVSLFDTNGGYSFAGAYVFVVPAHFNPGPSYAGSFAPGAVVPLNLDQGVDRGSYFTNSQPMYQADIRTRLKNDTILARYYIINQVNHPVSLTPTYSTSAPIWGTLALCPAGLGADPARSGNCGPNGGPYSTAPTVQTFNGQGAKMDLGYAWNDELRTDHTAGGSFEWNHPAGNNLWKVSYDQYKERSTDIYSYFPSGSPPAVTLVTIPPLAFTTTSTLSVREFINPSDRWNYLLAYYLEGYNSQYSLDGGATYGQTHIHHSDFRAGMTFHPNQDIALRFAIGSSLTPAFASITNNQTAPTPFWLGPPTNTYENFTSTGTLKPETAFSYDLGGDVRPRGSSDTVISWDAYRTNLHDQFYNVSTLDGSYNDGIHGSAALYSLAYGNLAKARYEGLEASVRRLPTQGLGYTLQGALIRAYTYDLPPGFYDQPGLTNSTNLTVIPNLNFSTGGTYETGGVPYSQGYGELNYRMRHGTYVSFGETYYGPNNSLRLPAFTAANATLRQPMNDRTSLQLSVENLFNIYSFPYEQGPYGIADENIPQAGYANTPFALGLGPRTFRIVYHMAAGTP